MGFPRFQTIYQFYSDEVARNASSIEIQTPGTSGGSSYGPSSLYDDNPAKYAKIEDTSGAWILTYAAKQRIQVAALIHHSFDDSGPVSVRLEGNNSDFWGTPSFSQAFVIPPWMGSGTGRWPSNPYMDLTDKDDYDDDGFFYWRLVIENNSQNIQLGQLWLGETIRHLDPDVRWGIRLASDKPQIENTTAFQISTIYPRGTDVWAYEGDLMAEDDLADDLERHWYDTEGRARPFLMVPSGPGPDDRARLVRYAITNRQAQWNFANQYEMKLAFQEVGRGLRPGV